MSEKSLRASSIGRRLIVRAYQKGNQPISFEVLSRAIREKTLQSQNLRLGNALLSLHVGGSRISAGCRIHGGRDIFGGAVVDMNSAVQQGHIQIIDEAVYLREGSLPEAKIVSMKTALDAGTRIPLGEIFSFDEECDRIPVTGIFQNPDRIPVTGIFQNPDRIRITLDAVWLPWEIGLEQMTRQARPRSSAVERPA